jgi:hypothetical protein
MNKTCLKKSICAQSGQKDEALTSAALLCSALLFLFPMFSFLVSKTAGQCRRLCSCRLRPRRSPQYESTEPERILVGFPTFRPIPYGIDRVHVPGSLSRIENPNSRTAPHRPQRSIEPDQQRTLGRRRILLPAVGSLERTDAAQGRQGTAAMVLGKVAIVIGSGTSRPPSRSSGAADSSSDLAF